jgi:DNA-binding MarR family transcriptional regulator
MIVRVTRSTAPLATVRATDRAAVPSAPSGPEALVDAIVTELHESLRELRCASTEKLVRRQLSMTQVHVLWLLDHHGQMPMSRLAELLDVSLSNATGLMDRMEEHGLVERVRLADDRRVVLVRPSEGGLQALEETDGVKRDRMRAILARLDESQLRRALAVFHDIRLAVVAELDDVGTSHPHTAHGASA